MKETPDFDKEKLGIEQAYNLTQGKFSYKNLKEITEFFYSLCASKYDAIKYAVVIKEITGEDSNVTEYIKANGFVINNDIITRNASYNDYKLSEQVGISMDRLGNFINHTKRSK